MKKDKIIEKINEGIRRCYHIAQSVYPRSISWDELNTKEVATLCKGKGFIWSGFYISKKEYDQIIKDLTKGTRYSWRWPYRTEIGKNGKIIPDPEWEEYKAAYDEKQKELEDKKITRKEFNAWQNAMGKKYNMKRRNYDREQIEFNIWNIAPSTQEDQYKEIENAYKEYISGIDSETAAQNAVPIVTDDLVNKEFKNRQELLEKNSGCSDDFMQGFLDKEEIRKSLESTYTNRVSVVKNTIEMLKNVWDEVLSKK